MKANAEDTFRFLHAALLPPPEDEAKLAVAFMETVMQTLDRYGFHVSNIVDGLHCVESLCVGMNTLEIDDAMGDKNGT